MVRGQARSGAHEAGDWRGLEARICKRHRQGLARRGTGRERGRRPVMMAGKK
jgi:hypothetical protein